jgi:uncharacterized membrane protein SirB2
VTLFAALKLVHMSCAFLSISGFTLRGYWMISGNPLLHSRPVRVAPHIVDTLLLATAVGMLVIWRVSPLQFDWHCAKIVALIAYIGLGMVALRFAKTPRVKMIAYLLALCCAGYIVVVAYSKNPMGFMSLLPAA